MQFLQSVVDVFLHIDTHLQALIIQYGTFTYALLFLVIFCETGLVVMPFLPGDSLLFAAGAFAARGAFHPALLFVLLTVAAILGDACNYALGHKLGRKVFSGKYPFLNHSHLMGAELFYEKHGGKAVIFARFLPIVRTLAPFVAGVGKMKYRKFAVYNIIGAIVWVGLFVFGGCLFGNIPAVEEHFSLVIVAIIGLSVAPPAIEFIRHWLGAQGADA